MRASTAAAARRTRGGRQPPHAGNQALLCAVVPLFAPPATFKGKHKDSPWLSAVQLGIVGHLI